MKIIVFVIMNGNDLVAQLQESYDNLLKVVNDNVLMARAVNNKIVDIYNKVSGYMFADRDHMRMFDEIEKSTKEIVMKYLNINVNRYDSKSAEFVISQCLAEEIYKKIQDNIEVDIMECIGLRVRQAREKFDDMKDVDIINMIDNKKNAYMTVMKNQQENIRQTADVLKDCINRYLEYDECIKGVLVNKKNIECNDHSDDE